MTRRRGTVYLFVIVTVLMATLITLSAIAALGAGEGTERLSRQRSQAGALAASATELAVQALATSLRAGLQPEPGEPVPRRTLGTGRLGATVAVPDSASGLSEFPAEVVVTSTGLTGLARSAVATTLVPREVPHDCLAYSVYAGGTITLEKGELRTSGTAFAATAGNGLYTSLAPGAAGPPAALPPAEMILAPYARAGSNLTLSGSRTLFRTLVSPASPPSFMTANPLGIYVIDLKGGELTIEDCRVLGTLVVRNAARVEVRGSSYLAPFSPELPALIVQGNLEISLASTEAREQTLGVNFNPAGAPYRGSTDSDTGDSYPVSIDGAVVATGSIRVTTSAAIHGQLIAGGDVALEGSGIVRVRPGFVGVRYPGLSQWPIFAVAPGQTRLEVER